MCPWTVSDKSVLHTRFYQETHYLPLQNIYTMSMPMSMQNSSIRQMRYHIRWYLANDIVKRIFQALYSKSFGHKCAMCANRIKPWNWTSTLQNLCLIFNVIGYASINRLIKKQRYDDSVPAQTHIMSQSIHTFQRPIAHHSIANIIFGTNFVSIVST